MTFCCERLAWAVDHMQHYNRVLQSERNECFKTVSEETCDIISQSLYSSALQVGRISDKGKAFCASPEIFPPAPPLHRYPLAPPFLLISQRRP